MTLGLMASLVKRGLIVAPFKVGPDFIDPGHHTRITGIASRNLDGWMLTKSYNASNFIAHTNTADIAVVEGVMGLFDGYDGKSESGSTAQMAKWMDLPVLLIVDARSMARSAAALIQGFERFDPDIKFAGVLFNNIGRDRHLDYLKDAILDNVTMPCLGGISHDTEIEIPERHLGLVTREDYPLSNDNRNRLAQLIENNLDVDTLIERLPDLNTHQEKPAGRHHPKSAVVRIGVPLDNAFCFYYPDNLEMLTENGAELVPFSPINGESLPGNLDGIYIGGGYPELFAQQLAKNSELQNQIKDKSVNGMPIYGECGGFMYLCKEIRDTEGRQFPMTGCFPFVTTMFSRLKSLGYREITLTKDTVIGKRGQTIRGHEFHYSELTEASEDIETVYQVSSRAGMHTTTEGYRVNRTLGSYNHLHFGSCPEVARQFVNACLDYKKERKKNL